MLQTRLASLDLDNPVLSASGTFGSGWEGRQFSDLGMVGGLVSKTVTKAPRPGNPPPRIYETPSGMLNAIGLENKGADYFLAETLPRMHELAEGGRRDHRFGPRVIVNIAGTDDLRSSPDGLWRSWRKLSRRNGRAERRVAAGKIASLEHAWRQEGASGDCPVEVGVRVLCGEHGNLLPFSGQCGS